MTTTLLESVKRNEAARRAEALASYRALIRRAHAPDDGDAEALESAMRALGLTSAELETDLAALSALKDAEAAVLSAGECEAVRRRAADAVAAAYAEMREDLVRRARGLDPQLLLVAIEYFEGRTREALPEETRAKWLNTLWYAESEGNGVLRASDAARQRAGELRRQHARALGD